MVRSPHWWAYLTQPYLEVVTREVCVCVSVCVHVPTSFESGSSCVVTVGKLVPASNFVRQSRYRKLMGKLSMGGPRRSVSCLHSFRTQT